VLSAAALLHLVRGVDVVQACLSAALLVAALVLRRAFGAPVDRRSSNSAALTVLAGLFGTLAVTTASVEALLAADSHGRGPLPLRAAVVGVAERLAGVRDVAFPPRVDRFLSPSLLAVGLALGVVAVLAVSRPFVDRALRSGAGGDEVARRLVSAHGGGTLDYFALRHDKAHWVDGRTLVSYAVHGGVCLVSPDPIGPDDERDAAWAAFCRFADDQGWIVAVLGAEPSWLDTYRRSGKHPIYVGDEAVVATAGFDLGGGHKKGLRQAVQRIRKYGYQVSFHDPSALEPEMAVALHALMERCRRGDEERGFSMTLGRLCDPQDSGLLVAVASDPQGTPVAFCQFVPAPAIGGYSLDVMRRDQGEHPNGLIDFLLVSTIEHLREQGFAALSLNFAAMRAYVAGERDGRMSGRLLRRVLEFGARSMQVESLWRFTAKYDPEWAARYLVVGSFLDLPAVGLAVARAESLWELPVIGRQLARVPGRARVRAA
jgi:lysylphosphatidylglycerol synthetase-like protein (DUF2156 family)